LLNGALSGPEQQALGVHLEACPRCQHLLRGLVADEASWVAAARYLARPDPPAESALRAVMARLANRTTISEAARPDDDLAFLGPPQGPDELGRLGVYQVLGLVGRGGMGVVLRAFDPTLARVVAVKVLAPQLAALPTARQRFLREARAAASIEHEHVVAIHAIDEANGLPCLVMPFIAGGSLQQWLDSGERPPLDEVLRIGKETAQGLAAAHVRGIVHRDVKPANILLEGPQRRVKITDFGLARTASDPALTGSGVIAGTPQYMAPEQARGQGADHRADLFSLGSVLYALCTGKPPFEASSALAVLRRVSDDEPPFVAALNPSVPPWLVAIISRLHTKDPAARFQSANEVAQLLDRHLAQRRPSPPAEVEPVLAQLVSPPRAVRRKRRWALAAVAAVAVGMLVVLAATAALVVLGKRSSQGEPQKEEDQQVLAQEARAVLATYCHRCHGQDGAVEGGFNYLLDRRQLVAHKKVVPGQPERSPLLRRIRDSEMPPEGQKRPTDEEMALLERWIEAGAPDFAPEPASPSFVSPAEVARAIRDDLRRRPEHDRCFTRYFTLTHLFNAGLSSDELQSYRNGLAKLLNSLSWKKDLVLPAPVDAARTVLRIDLRDLGWTDSEWRALVAVNPYGVEARSPEQEYIAAATETALAELRGDWFVAVASRPPLYHQLLQLPKNEGELEKMLRIDIAANIKSKRVVRAGFNGSGVSRNNRLIERHETPYGACWKSYDFAANTGAQNLFERPLGPGLDDRSFRHVGGEIIFNLPNGLQGYLLVDGKGQRLDRAPTDIVSDPRRPDRAVENGLSCMGCHSRGINPKADQIRAHVLANPKAFPNKNEVDTILALYPSADRLDALMQQDRERFSKAAAATGAKVGATEPIIALVTQFEAPLDLRRAAAEVGLRPAEFLARLEQSPAIGRAIGAIKLAEGRVQRQAFAEVFADLVREWKLGSAVKPASRQDRPVAIPAPKLTAKVEIQLPAPFEQVRTGGAGRYLLFHLRKLKKLAVFDISQMKVIHNIDVPDDVRYAAGLDKLMIAVPGQSLLQRWDLRTAKREATVGIPDGGVQRALMGCNGRGPLFLFMGGHVTVWDVQTMKRVEMDRAGLEGSPMWDFQGRISADGQVLTLWHGAISPTGYGLVRLQGRKKTVGGSKDQHSFNERWAMPNADGSLIFRFGPGLYDGDMRAIAVEAFKNQVLLPTEDPRFFLTVQEESQTTNRVRLCTSVDRQVVVTVAGVEKMTSSSMSPRWGQFAGEPRVHYLPTANVLVTLPESNDRVVLRPLNLREQLQRSGQDYLVVLSKPDTRVVAGATFAYPMDVLSKSGGLRYKLEAGPEGMTVSAAGVVRWLAPDHPPAQPIRVIITVSSASGKEVQHAFDLTVVEPVPAGDSG
jgi:mono/diheme cytochrome c family protein